MRVYVRINSHRFGYVRGLGNFFGWEGKQAVGAGCFQKVLAVDGYLSKINIIRWFIR